MQYSIWSRRGGLAYALRPVSWLLEWYIKARRERGLGWQQQHPINRPPVVVIGNLRVGGVGKTPLLIFLVQTLQVAGYRVGVVSRGYGGVQSGKVQADSDPRLFGDEPVLIAQQTQAPVVVNTNRYQALLTLLAHAATTQTSLDIVFSDDGLQHYHLPRDFEVVVMDGRGLGNGWVFPAGPLREPPSRLHTVDHLVLNQSVENPTSLNQLLAPVMPLPVTIPSTQMSLRPLGLFRVQDDEPVPRSEWQQPLVAVCGIGYPPRFFASLQQLGLQFTTRVFADHHAFVPKDLRSAGPVVMTQKDAVKIRAWAKPQHWYLGIQVSLDSDLLMQQLLGLCEKQPRICSEVE